MMRKRRSEKEGSALTWQVAQKNDRERKTSEKWRKIV